MHVAATFAVAFTVVLAAKFPCVDVRDHVQEQRRALVCTIVCGNMGRSFQVAFNPHAEDMVARWPHLSSPTLLCTDGHPLETLQGTKLEKTYGASRHLRLYHNDRCRIFGALILS